MSLPIAIQGYAASFHHLAAQHLYGPDVEILPCDSFRETFEAVRDGRARAAVCAIENSLFGSINETYDLLLAHKFQITGEYYLRISQNLIGLPGTQLADITEVYSHPVALAQCDDYLSTQLSQAERLEYPDTAAAVEKVKLMKRADIAAIASVEAAKLHGLEILKPDIETNKQNYTRFIVVEEASGASQKADKTSMVIRTTHEAGALYRALGVFAERGMSLTKLQSRPIMFYLDVDCGASESAFQGAITDLSTQGCEVKVLGSYRAAV
jgi:prephenate dehydratase